MGVAHVACIRGCSCKRLLLEFRAEANTGIAATEVRHLPSNRVLIRAVFMSKGVVEGVAAVKHDTTVSAYTAALETLSFTVRSAASNLAAHALPSM
jgi:hypothetical protein